MGRGVSIDFERAVHDALGEAGVSDYFDPGNPLHQTLNLSAAGTSAVSPVLLLAFSPGATKNQPSLSHDIHTMLRKGSANRIPIFGGSSADYFRYESNCQIVNSRVANDAVAIAFIETEILFGLGMANGFSPTTKRALVTEAEGHVVKQLDGRPAAEVYAEFLGIPDRALMAEHAAGPLPLSGYPFGSTDVYGNSILHVPERILDNGSIIFPQLMKNHQVITLMQGPREDVVKAGVSAYEKAIRRGGLNKPSVGFMFSCALRLTGESEQEEVALLRRKAKIPICGFYTYGEKGIFDDGLPVYSNQSVSMLVFSDELNPVASLIHEGKRIHHEFTSRLNRKVSQIKSINRINMIIQDGTDVSRLLTALTSELSALFPWAHGAFYLSTDELETYAIASASDFDAFPEELRTDKAPSDYILIKLDSPRKCFGYLVLKERKDGITPEEEDLVLAETIARLTASGLHRIELDGRLEAKLQQLDILNQLGHELSKSISTSSQSQNMVRHIRRILKLSFASLWLVDRSHHLLVKEAVDVDPGTKLGKLETENDERVTKWQMENKESLLVAKPTNDSCPISLLSPFPFSFITLPVISKGELLGNLNLYSSHSFKWPLQHDRIFENMDFLRSISTQIAMFHENRSLHKHATFNKEIHHRVKNNLQNIASLLRLQLRRLDHLSPEQALTDSISRIMSMALVHETLSQNEIGMVDLGPLLGSISKVPDFPDRQMITLDVSGPPVLLPSREATSLALVVNELVQNALHHGLGRRRDGKISLRIERTDSLISVVVQDDGPGLTENFDPGRHANLGLTIVRTLVKEDLKGEFSIGSEDGTKATVTFPLPEGCYQID
jgi:two-component sensor histidine kinase